MSSFTEAVVSEYLLSMGYIAFVLGGGLSGFFSSVSGFTVKINNYQLLCISNGRTFKSSTETI